MEFLIGFLCGVGVMVIVGAILLFKFLSKLTEVIS